MAEKKRVSNNITKKEDVEYIINLTERDLTTASTIYEMFGDFSGEDKPKFHTYDTITIPPGKYILKNGKPNTKPFVTTVGIWCFNRCFIEPRFSKLLGYINEEIDAKKFGDINNKTLSYALLEDKIKVEDLEDFIMKGQFYMQFSSVISYNFTEKFLTMDKRIEKKKMELINKNKVALANGDAQVMEDIEKELIEYSKELLKDDPSYDAIACGAGADWKNNFKNMFISKGATKDPDPEKGYNIITSSLMEGIKKEEYVAFANTLIAGPYARGKKTEIGGYQEKLLLSVTQHVVAGPPGSDCGTKRTITVKLDSKTMDDMMYSYIVEGNKLIELTSENRDKYVGKTVKMRYSSMCQSKDCKCNKCLGNLFYRLTTNKDGTKYISNVGAASPQLASRLKNINMKAFHESLVTFTEMNPMEAFGFE